MPYSRLTLRWPNPRRLTAFDRFADSLRLLIALSGVMAYTGLKGDANELIPLMLGVIASGLAETNDNWRRRAQALLLTLLCFLVAAFIVEALLGHPWLFMWALPLGTFVLVMLGAASGRYATIANATLLLSVYTMIGVQQHADSQTVFWHEPLLLVVGAGWYGALALVWNAVFGHRPVRHSLARLYDALAGYLVCKSWLFEPVRDLDVSARRSELARSNAQVVAALNDTRLALIDRLNGRRSRSAMNANLRLYLTAQDIHERASSAHYPYKKLTEAFFHSDLLFRCQRLLRLTGRTCQRRSESIRYNEPFREAPHLVAACEDVESALGHRRQLTATSGEPLLHVVEDLADNLRELAECVRPGGDDSDQSAGEIIQNPQPRSPGEAWQRIRLQLTPASARFRHALRLALAMMAGYIVLQLVHPVQGYWILLTTMLVCQPDYGATRSLLTQRVGGTIVGLVAGWALLQLFPSPQVQLLLVVVTGVAFFATRFRYYFVATAMISVLVLLSFNQVGNGFDLIAPRLIDTLIGGALAAAVMLLVLPDWRERDLHHRLADALSAHAAYLRVIFDQYRTGRHDNLVYRIARRDAHDADAAVSGHVSSAISDPRGARTDSREAFAVLACTQTLIGHLSTLGAHRQLLAAGDDGERLARAVEHVAQALEDVAHALIRSDAAAVDGVSATRIYDDLAELAAHRDGGIRLVAGQLQLLLEALPELRRISLQLVT